MKTTALDINWDLLMSKEPETDEVPDPEFEEWWKRFEEWRKGAAKDHRRMRRELQRRRRAV